MRLNFQQKLVLSSLVIFTAFTVGIIVFEQRQARRYKTDALQERLDAYADEVTQYIQAEDGLAAMDSLLPLLPSNLRLTLVDRGGKVVYDNLFADPSSLENHSDRREIADAIDKGSGTFVRTSVSTHTPYLYYAKDNGNSMIVRVALPYDIKVRSFLKPDNAFLYFVIALFLVGFLFIYYISRHFGSAVRHLRDFSMALNSGREQISVSDFPDDELRQIAGQLADDFNRIRGNRKQLTLEREKLLLHIQTSAEGVCFFNPDSTVAFYNGLFMQYLNTLSTGAISSGREILGDASFRQVAEFLENHGSDNYYETRIGKHGKEFLLRLNIFEDGSFEIILTDITARERSHRLKQEMTGNIAHELRTPVTSIRGFLEILMNNQLGEAKAREYLERAYSQTQTLSELISDMSLLTRIDEKRGSLDFLKVDVNKLLEKVRTDTAAALAEKNISFTADIPAGMTVRGNETLLYSVFRNLTDNVAAHAGKDIEIQIKALETKDGKVRFSFADTGKGIADEHLLDRIFERFYRVGEGRTRDSGGSGLGLAIVKNTVLMHGGTISAKNRKEGGLEFLIQLPE